MQPPDSPETPSPDAPRERMFNIPWPVTALAAVLIGAFLIQTGLGADAAAMRFGFHPADLARGRYETLLLSLFLHGGWAHVLMNTAFLIALGAPVARRMGEDATGAAGFFGLYLVCGLLANLAYAGLNPGDENPVVGASGAIAGLMGAASRLMTPGPDLAAFRSPPVVGLATAWLLINLLFGVVLKGWSPGSGGAPIAWQVHLVGFAVGLLLLSPALRLMRRL